MLGRMLLSVVVAMVFAPSFFFGAGYNPNTGQYDPIYNPPGTTTTTIVFPRKMTISNQMYPFGLDGIKSYMRDIQNENPELYTALKPDMDDLDKRTSSGWTYMIGGNVLGIGIVVTSIVLGTTVLAEKKEFMGETHSTPNMGIMIGGSLVGAGIMAIGTIVGLSSMPKDEDYYNFVNKHNRLDKENPIKVELGYNPCRESFEGTLAFQF
jgi:hypothetical protein